MDENDILLTSWTDSVDMYRTRLEELEADRGPYTQLDAVADRARYLDGATTDFFRELGHVERKAIHNLKYFTWVEQQGKTVEELNQLWDPGFWTGLADQIPALDKEIERFNRDADVPLPKGK